MTQHITLPSSIQTQLKRLGVVAVYLFGSRAMGLETERSDFDFAVLFEKSGHQRGDKTYRVLYELLSTVSPRTLKNDVIDIVFLRDAPLELQCHVIRYGRLLFDRDPRARANFEADVMLRYCDYRPILDEFDRTILESL